MDAAFLAARLEPKRVVLLGIHPDTHETEYGFDVLVSDLGTPREALAAERLYARLPAADFSRRVLAERPRALAVLPVSGVAWSDLGSPDRALRVRATLGSAALDPVPG